MPQTGASRTLTLTAGLVLVAVLAVGGVVLALRALDIVGPLVESCTAGSSELAPDQTANAALIVGTAMQRGLPARAGTIGIATAMQESRMRAIDYGDRDSLGMFQQRPSQGWGTPEHVMDPVYATSIFFDVLVEVPGYTEMPVTEAAQAVQRSGFPDAYAQHEGLARAFASSLTGWNRGDLSCTLAEAEPEAAAGMPEAVLARLQQDLGLTGVIRDAPTATAGPTASGEASEGPAREVVVEITDPGPASPDHDRWAWAVAQWAVATASVTGAGQVAVVDQVWERDGHDSGWRQRTLQEPMPARGQIVISAR